MMLIIITTNKTVINNIMDTNDNKQVKQLTTDNRKLQQQVQQLLSVVNNLSKEVRRLKNAQHSSQQQINQLVRLANRPRD